VLKRIQLLKEASGAQLLVVFDGATPPIKEKECLERSDKRKKAAKERDEPLDQGEEANVNSIRRLRAARRAGAGKNHGDIVVEVMMALRREQIPFMVAPYEADGQLAYFQSEMKMIDLVVTEDSDLIAHGCHSILYKTADDFAKGSASGILVQRGDLSAKGLVPKCLSLVDFSDVMLAVMFVALGCDYCSSLKQIGSVTARDVVRDAFHGEKKQSEQDWKRPALEKLFEKLYEKTSEKGLTDEFKQEYEATFLAALLMYRHPMIYDPFVKKCVLLRNPPHGSDPELMDFKPYADLCSDVKRREEIVGACHGSVISTRIAEGWLNPRTKRPYENMAIPLKVKDVPLSLSASDSDSEEETEIQTQDMPPKPARHATETVVEDPETQDDHHVETQLATPSPAQNWSERQSVEGPETQDNSRSETQHDTQDSWPSSEEVETSIVSNTFTMSFETKKLGIILYRNLAVQSIMNTTLEQTLKKGDTLVAINGSTVGKASLEEIQERLKKLPRPVKVTFSRSIVAMDDNAAQDNKSTSAVVYLTQGLQSSTTRCQIPGSRNDPD
jgi:exonuclease-1